VVLDAVTLADAVTVADGEAETVADSEPLDDGSVDAETLALMVALAETVALDDSVREADMVTVAVVAADPDDVSVCDDEPEMEADAARAGATRVRDGNMNAQQCQLATWCTSARTGVGSGHAGGGRRGCRARVRRGAARR